MLVAVVRLRGRKLKGSVFRFASESGPPIWRFSGRRPCLVQGCSGSRCVLAPQSMARRQLNASGQSHPNTTDQTKPGCAQRRHGPARVLKSKPLLPPPALRERGHRGLARRRVAVRRSAILVVAEGQRPKRGTPPRARRRYLAGLTGKMTAFGIAPETVVALAIAARPEAVCNE
jgi:hypothetical protein